LNARCRTLASKNATQVVKASESGPVTNDVASEIRRVIHRRLDVAEDRITLDASFVDDLGVDSLALVDLTLDFEETFNIEKLVQARASA
jgi:acyl carrier protein